MSNTAHNRPSNLSRIGANHRVVRLTKRIYRRVRKAALTALAAVMGAVIAVAACSDPGSQVARGTVAASWSIVDLNRQPTTCVLSGATTVVLRLRDRAGADSLLSFPCGSSPGSAQVTAAPYDVTPELRAADGTVLATGPAQTGVSVGAGQVVPLTPVVFAASTKGGLKLSIASPPLAANCGSGPDSAGISGMSITLIRSFGSCAPVTFDRSVDGHPSGTYTVNCGSPRTASCIKNNETLTTNVEAGTYTVHVRGSVGATTCWKNDDTFEVPPPGQTLTRTLNLAHLAGC